MNWDEGPSSSRWVQAERPTPARIMAMLAGIAAALDHLRTGVDTAGTAVLHRDVKPANLIVTGDAATLVEFGLARLLDPRGPSMTMAGTPAFLAPEVITDHRCSAASDRYAFAGTLYQLSPGSNPNVFPPQRMRSSLQQFAEGDRDDDAADGDSMLANPGAEVDDQLNLGYGP